MPVERAFGDLSIASKLQPLPGSESIRFGDSVTLEKMYAWKKGEDYEVFGIWHLHGRNSVAQSVGIHILDDHAEIIGQEDHNLLPSGLGKADFGLKRTTNGFSITGFHSEGKVNFHMGNDLQVGP